MIEPTPQMISALYSMALKNHAAFPVRVHMQIEDALIDGFLFDDGHFEKGTELASDGSVATAA